MAKPMAYPSTPDSEVVDLGAVMTDIAHELATLSEKCTLVQWSISTLLDRADHPDLGAEIHMLQDVDRIQQTLNDIASVMTVTRAAANGIACRRDEIGKAIRMESLRQRLGLSFDLSDQDREPDDSGITWL